MTAGVGCLLCLRLDILAADDRRRRPGGDVLRALCRDHAGDPVCRHALVAITAAAGCDRLGLLTYGAGLFGMTTIALAPLCGALFGFGYGVTLPSSIEWSTRLYPQNRRPVALINSSFQAGSIIALQITGLLLASIGWGGVLTALGTMVAVVFLMIAVTQAVRQ